MSNNRIFVPPRIWTKVTHNFFVFYQGPGNAWVQYADGKVKVGKTGLWGYHHGPVDSLPTSWDQVTEKKTVRKVD